jgi:hypothetical protein
MSTLLTVGIANLLRDGPGAPECRTSPTAPTSQVLGIPALWWRTSARWLIRRHERRAIAQLEALARYGRPCIGPICGVVSPVAVSRHEMKTGPTFPHLPTRRAEP